MTTRSIIGALAVCLSLVTLGAAGTASASAVDVVSVKDKRGDVRFTGAKGESPHKKMRRSVDLRRVSIDDFGSTRAVEFRVKRLATGRFRGFDQIFSLSVFSASGEYVASAGISHRKGKGGWAYSEVTQESCEVTKIRRNRPENTITAVVPARCLPLPYGGRVVVTTMLGIYRSDAPVWARDRRAFRIAFDW